MQKYGKVLLDMDMETLTMPSAQKRHVHSVVLSSVRPKPGFGVGNQNQGPIRYWSSNFFFPEPELFLFKIFKIF